MAWSSLLWKCWVLTTLQVIYKCGIISYLTTFLCIVLSMPHSGSVAVWIDLIHFWESPIPLPSNIQHLSYGDCLEGKRGHYLTSSVLLHCWLGHLTCKIVSEMTYNASSWTLNPTIPYHLGVPYGPQGSSVPQFIWWLCCNVNCVCLFV